jgi:hypothetical protein
MEWSRNWNREPTLDCLARCERISANGWRAAYGLQADEHNMEAVGWLA